ncbi:hypothetical protein YB2330_002750 [Saitoella coloradoensis]
MGPKLKGYRTFDQSSMSDERLTSSSVPTTMSTLAESPESSHPTTRPNSGNGEHIIDMENQTVVDEVGGRMSPNRLRTAARKIINLRRMSSGYRNAGAEPGLDVRTMTVALEANCSVTVTDFSKTTCRQTEEMDNSRFIDFLAQDSPRQGKVRWINVNGHSWDVIRDLAMKYNLHRLAVEDLLHIPQRTKVDQYSTHTFICLNLHTLIYNTGHDTPDKVDEKVPSDSPRSYISNLWKAWRKERIMNEQDLDEAAAAAAGMAPEELPRRTLQRMHHHNVKSVFLDSHQSLKSRGMAVAVEQVSIFLMDDNTVISVFEHSAPIVAEPIVKRLLTRNTLLRSSQDASLLVQSILDGIVDLAFPIISTYQEHLSELEIDVLTTPEMAHTRQLHILSGELNLLKRTLSPITSIVNSLRDHAKTVKISEDGRPGSPHGGEISDLARIYLADVADHVQTLVENIEMMKSQTDSSTDLIFNTMATLQNESMKQLTLVTLVFLPLTFLTGYFGMNFTQFGALDHDLRYFWQIAGPTTGAVVLMVSYGWLKRHLVKTVRKVEKKITRTREEAIMQKEGFGPSWVSK